MTRPIPPPYRVVYNRGMARYDISNGATGEVLAHTYNEHNATIIRDALNLKWLLVQNFKASITEKERN